MSNNIILFDAPVYSKNGINIEGQVQYITFPNFMYNKIISRTMCIQYILK